MSITTVDPTTPRHPDLPEPWVSKRTLALHYEASVSWVEERMREGMPSALIGGMRRFQVSVTDRWLADRQQAA